VRCREYISAEVDEAEGARKSRRGREEGEKGQRELSRLAKLKLGPLIRLHLPASERRCKTHLPSGKTVEHREMSGGEERERNDEGKRREERLRSVFFRLATRPGFFIRSKLNYRTQFPR